MEQVISFLSAANPLELALIFFAKIIEVSLATLRQILINKGYRRVGTILSFFEILLWTFVASRVIIGITEAPVKGIVYSIGFSLDTMVWISTFPRAIKFSIREPMYTPREKPML